jgi:broad specificity phosphatase PhoE
MLKNTNILIIRHGEKPFDGSDGLTPAGQARAQAYISYFQNYIIDSEPIKWTALFAAASSKTSRRPLLTLEPLAKTLGLPIDAKYDDKDTETFVKALQENPSHDNANILISWRHSGMLELADALGVEGHQLPESANWVSKPFPPCVFGWVLQICFDEHGEINLNKTKCIPQKLMFGDHGQNPPNANCQ